MTLQITGNNMNGSPELSLARGKSTTFAWSPFGGGAMRTGNVALLPGFNGERQDPLSGVTHLGNGYRAYSPALRRFTCPDSESPFGAGGINPYVYCDHDPVNNIDPSGHAPISERIRKVASQFERQEMKTAEESMSSAVATVGSVSSGTELAAQGATGVSQTITRARGNTETAQNLGWASLGTGVAGGMGLAEGDNQQVVNRLSKGWINRRKRTYTLSSYPPSHSFDTFDLYQSPNNPNKRVIITAHGMQTLRGKSAYLPKGVSFRYYSSDGNALYDPGLMRMALGPEYNTPRETLNGPGRIRNYQLERYPHDTPQEITKVVNTMEVDIIAITKNTSLRHVLKVLDQNNLNYSVIEGCFCRSSLKASILDFLKIAEVPVQSVERH
ncbi:TPA_asm: RHS repeat-associated core domain-containing protein [Salmonella enterica subsp. indica]|uniref:RHS repeat-associated core domain-containing protein n=2 Tax=Salmonella enterica TaxID=28901 RepID=A0A702E5U9_SALER|nr:RHS repeat-associated core domain-containing protein [Salmonella enterica subsp. indica]HBC0159537.1 RHS repeat-associated core domain-containing protein [Salmonella enterica subsp. indica]HCM1935187.1 RHS repeat-associated core domain-containing protein [Salmonella enterica subsp. indica serovar 6,7:z41:1,7]